MITINRFFENMTCKVSWWVRVSGARYCPGDAQLKHRCFDTQGTERGQGWDSDKGRRDQLTMEPLPHLSIIHSFILLYLNQNLKGAWD